MAFNLDQLLEEYTHHKERIRKYDEKIHALSQADEYREKVKSLICYRGFNVIAAMAVICEIGDIRRFAHPRQLVSYTGLGIREYSSGGKENKFGITRIGNKYLRATVVESAQKALRKPAIGKDLKSRRKGISENYIKIADHCMARLNKKGIKMIARGKHNNKTKVACAREWMGFIWESLQLAQAA